MTRLPHLTRRQFVAGIAAVTLGSHVIRGFAHHAAPSVALARQDGGSWTDRAPMPSQRGEVAVCESAGRIYVLGGFGGGSTLNEAYDPGLDRWQTLAAMPRGVHHTSAAGLNGQVYVAGGYDVDTNEAVATLSQFDPSSNQWTALQPMPSRRGALGLITLNGALHAIGGDANGDLNAHEVYDPATDRWSSAAPIPTARDHLAIAELNGRIYVLGGRSPALGMVGAVTESYDPTTDRWTELEPMPTGRSGIAAATLDGRIYVFGGEDPRRTYNEAESFDPVSRSWMVHTVMPYARHGLGAAAVAGTIYVIAGGLTPGFASSDINQAFQPGIPIAHKP